MFECQRCKSSYSARHAATMANCPRCLAKDKVATPLAFRPFSRVDLNQPALAGREAQPPAA